MEHKNSSSPYIIVRNSKIHGRGVFAKKDIPKGARIIEYVGERITKAEAERRAEKLLNKHKENQVHGAVYLFVLNKRHDIDGYVPYNTARHINHSCDPNAETEIIRGKIWIIAIKNIKKGEEITYNYSYDYDGYDEHHCYCRTNRCVGYILAEEHWPRLKKDSLKKKKL
ncbi:MAG: SET domain-containing protein-lysine N-methyltransferase [Candidatus Omnitrophica bacterium]|nr:SET domain-containing protein-lysine N-methyltransferase [Candidatus Omnitrophota bacterium]